MTLRILPSGERAVLVELADAAAAHAFAAHVRESAAGDVEDVVPGARTVLVVAREASMLEALTARLEASRGEPKKPTPSAEVSIDVVYDGEDLAEVAQLTGLDVADVVRRHSSTRYTVEFIGFAPGFAYLSGLDPALNVPRLASPRPSVPAGSVAIAGQYSAVYPRSSPGGWRLLGRTDAVLFDVAADPPSPLAAGTVVRFVPR